MPTQEEKERRAEGMAERTAVSFAVGQLVGLAMKYDSQPTLSWELREIAAMLIEHFRIEHPAAQAILAAVRVRRAVLEDAGGVPDDPAEKPSVTCERCGKEHWQPADAVVCCAEGEALPVPEDVKWEGRQVCVLCKREWRRGKRTEAEVFEALFGTKVCAEHKLDVK